MSEGQRAVLRAVCDTVVPSIERPDDPDGFWARSASDVGAPEAVEQTIDQLPPEQRDGMLQLLDGLAEMGFLFTSRKSREQLLRNLAMLGPEAAGGANALTGLTLFFSYGLADPQSGQNPFWKTFAYPGPPVQPEPREKAVTPLVPDADGLSLEADACVVGSGAGGSVIAAQLAEAGHKVVVLEAGGHFDESDFNGQEVWAYQNMYWRGGPNPTADMNVALYAGSTYGGGTTINWTNCLRTKPWVRDEWAQEFGLEGLDSAEFDRHLDSVWERLQVNDRCSHLNGTQTRMKEGAEALGWSFKTITRNIDESRYDPDTAGYIGFGDPTGAKQSTAKTYLQDVAERGGEVVARCFAQRVITENGRAAGVEALYVDPESGHGAPVSVRAPLVVVACGALESPALLLRSGIGGPAVGQNLRLHPCTAIFASYGEDQRAWWGAPHAGLVDEFANIDAGYGFLIEATQYAAGTGASALPFVSGERHKELLSDYKNGATFIGLLRDHGGGQVTIGEDGQALPWYSLEDNARDVRNTKQAIDAQIRLHVAAGAHEIQALAAGLPRWRLGDDLDAYVERCQRIPLRAGGFKLFAAHQMGTCRMGSDKRTSVANPWGELHDTPGVWIGDASAFPTPSGTNPMITIMALARRTGEAILAASPSTAAVAQS
ncbi:MAG TPA: GMC family oxidoreductase [Thermoleophilaceae bacterium]|nr:GMC family oxidoreductase [Thermoleophilaceae bacterium]